MKEDSQLKKIITVLMIFLLLAQMSGCVSTRIISTSDLPTKFSKYAYIVHCENLKFLLKQPIISKDTLSSKIIQIYMDNSYDQGNKIHLYLSSDSVIKIDNKGEFLCLPLDEVTKAELHEIHGVLGSSGVVAVILGVSLTILIVYGFIEFMFLFQEI